MRPDLIISCEEFTAPALVLPIEAMGLTSDTYRCAYCGELFSMDGHESPTIMDNLQKYCNVCAELSWRYLEEIDGSGDQ